jgi:hypothetical protein
MAMARGLRRDRARRLLAPPVSAAVVGFGAVQFVGGFAHCAGLAMTEVRSASFMMT